MKKRLLVILCVILATLILTACGGAGNFSNNTASSRVMGDSNYAITARAEPEAPQAVPMPMPVEADDAEMSFYSYSSDGADALMSGTGGAGITSITAHVTEGFAEKIIYYVYAEIETRRFDDSIAAVHTLMETYGAFIENSSISGVNYAAQQYGWSTYRHAYFSLRVPKENLDAATESLDNIGNVTHRNSNATNITSQFFDTQSRLNSLLIQEERLLDMLSKAEDVPDLILIEERLSDVRYQIEWFATTLNNWQSQVDYSYLTLEIREVEQFSERPDLDRSYWQQIADGFMSTIRGIGNFFMDLFKWLIVSAPVLIILAAITIAVLMIVKWKLRSIAKKKANKPEGTVNANPPVYQYNPYPSYPQYEQPQPEQTQTPTDNSQAVPETAPEQE